MTQKEFAEKYASKKAKKIGLKDKKKAKGVVESILKCFKCGRRMTWIRDTNQCFCPDCTYPYGKKEEKKMLNVSKTLSEKSRKFLEDNYDAVAPEFEKESVGEENA